jgi:hypothetical protein
MAKSAGIADVANEMPVAKRLFVADFAGVSTAD